MAINFNKERSTIPRIQIQKIEDRYDLDFGPKRGLLKLNFILRYSTRRKESTHQLEALIVRYHKICRRDIIIHQIRIESIPIDVIQLYFKNRNI